MISTISKDRLAVSQLVDGVRIQLPPLWSHSGPHHDRGGSCDANGLCWESEGRLWSGGKDGMVKCWLPDSGRNDHVMEIPCFPSSEPNEINNLEVWPEHGMIAVTSAHGISHLDTRAGKIARKQYTNHPAHRVRRLGPGSSCYFATMGSSLNQYDDRMFVEGPATKAKAVAQWNLREPIIGLDSVASLKGHALVAVGCGDGRVAAFDTT